MKIRTEKVIDVSEWNNLVKETYGKPYNFQQQNDCRSRGTFYLTVPDTANDYENTTVPEIVNHNKMGVSFAAWLARDPKQKLSEDEECRDSQWAIDLWWKRNFYPDIQTIANDLYEKKLIEAGDYLIDIDW